MKKYKIIYVDPPWSFSNKNTGGSMKSGADAHYTTMSISDLKNMDIQSICDKDCILFMWWVSSQPQEALDLVKSWGFKIKNMNGFVWVKRTKLWKLFFGMGFWTRAGSESCLIAVKGKIKPVNKSVRAVVEAINEKHSKKPDLFADKIVELMGDLPRLEIFARDKKKGWDIFGNEINSDITIPNKKTLFQ